MCRELAHRAPLRGRGTFGFHARPTETLSFKWQKKDLDGLERRGWAALNAEVPGGGQGQLDFGTWTDSATPAPHPPALLGLHAGPAASGDFAPYPHQQEENSESILFKKSYIL